MAHPSRRDGRIAGRVVALAMSAVIGAMAPITMDPAGSGWWVWKPACAAGRGRERGGADGGSRGYGAAPAAGAAAGSAGAAGGYGAGQIGSGNGAAPDDAAGVGGGTAVGAPGGYGAGRDPIGRGPAPGAAAGGKGAGEVGAAPDGPTSGGGPGPAEQATDHSRTDAAATGRRDGGGRVDNDPIPFGQNRQDFTRGLEQIGRDLSPAEEAALIAGQWR
jgi:hypothetical protein